MTSSGKARVREALTLSATAGAVPRVRAPGVNVAVGDPVLPTDSVERDLHRLGPEPAGEDLAVVGEDLVRDPVAAKGRGQDLALRLGDGPADQGGWVARRTTTARRRSRSPLLGH